MNEDMQNVPLAQLVWEDHLARVRREKIGDTKELASVGHVEGAEIVGADTTERKAIIEKIVDAIKEIYDPEIPLNIYDLGLIYKVAIDPSNAVKVDMTLTAPGCPVAGALVEEVRRKVEAVVEVSKAEVELVWEPPWTKERLSEAARLDLGLM